MSKRLAVITGATSGIGAAYARAFARKGYDLLLTGRREQELTELAEHLRQELWSITPAMPKTAGWERWPGINIRH